ncbi:redox-regulated ATPase YchF [bacterium]|nr:redox-regulated ATPase YchF [bacterium]
MGVRCGIIGLPNVGKSTIFNALTAASVEASNYPFCTIDPNIGRVALNDERLGRINALIHTKKVVPSTVEFVDIAGLVRGAHKGEGLGNQFLSHIMEMDALAHTVRCFADSDVVHVEGALDPIRDIEIVETEIILRDIELLTRGIERLRRTAKSGDASARKELAACEELIEKLHAGIDLRHAELTPDETAKSAEMKLLSAKPVLYLLNVAEDDLNGTSDSVRRVTAYAADKGISTVCMSGKIEEELVRLDPSDRLDFMRDLGLARLGLDTLIETAFKTLRLVTFFTANENELHAWNISDGTRAPQAAGKIHTDFERGFIKAEVVSYDDFIAHKGEHGAKEHGALRIEGKDYCVRDGDIILFRFSV